MTGGLIQLASYGGADIYITGNPEITYFKTVYRRHTNFAKESIIQHIDGRVGYGRTVNIDITRAGDLLGPIWLQLQAPMFLARTDTDEKWYYTQGLGNALVKRVDLVIGGQLIDRQYGEWMAIWEELSVSTGRRPGLDAMTLTNVPMSNLAGFVKATSSDADNTTYLNVPLQFWFCRNPALALPLVAMSLHEVRLQLEFGSLEDITSSYIPSQTLGAYTNTAYPLVIPKDSDMAEYTNGQNMECEVWATYYHLDSDERRQLTLAPLEYLVELVQFKGHQEYRTETRNIKYDLGFANPVKELIWGIRPILDIPNFASGYFSTYRTRTRPSFGQFWGEFGSGVVRFNSQNRMKDRPRDHFLLTQNYQRHTRVPRYNQLTGAQTVSNASYETGPIYVPKLYTYSFGLNPEQYQPSGTANFTKLDDASLELRDITIPDPLTWGGSSIAENELTQYYAGLELAVYATSYNVLRVKDGMCGLAFDA
jgi:hypothetical protein